MKKKIAIIGAGISGLALAFFLQQRFGASLDITIFEAAAEPGGWIRTVTGDSGLFEQGPRTLRMTSNSPVERLIHSLGIQDSVITSSPEAKVRFIAKDGALLPLPHSLTSFFSSPLALPLAKGVFFDLIAPRGADSGESVASFFTRRFGKEFHDTFLEPLCSGIYAANPRLLSMQATFPSLQQKESKYRSVVFGSLFSKGPQHTIVSFSEGLGFLPHTIAKRLEGSIVYNTPVQKIKELPQGRCEVITQEASYEFDHVALTLAPHLMKLLFSPHDALYTHLSEYISTSVVTVSLAFHQGSILPGFGFLCSELQESELLGIVFDSNIFPEHNKSSAVRLSVMMGGSRAPDLGNCPDEALLQKAQQYVKKYLKISTTASFSVVCRATKAIALYDLKQCQRCTLVAELVKNRPISLLGASFSGVSVADCIQSAYDMAQSGRIDQLTQVRLSD